jgi:4-hydroxy-2-oxoheptanedioate aldolase
MQTPINRFKQALKNRQPQIGLWTSLASSYSTEICAGAGFDWLLLDGEHAPNDLQGILSQLQVIAGYENTHPVVRLPVGHGHIGTTLIKQYLDLGVQTLLIPMVDTAEQAAAIVQATRYPPQGIRGMGGARASRWGRYSNYPKEANDQICVLVQVETQLGLDNLEAIAAVDGIDGIFIGPADLSASLGHVGNANHPQVRSTIDHAFSRILKAGKAPGFLTPDEDLSRHSLSQGVVFMAVGLDVNLLARHTSSLASRFKNTSPVKTQTSSPY